MRDYTVSICTICYGKYNLTNQFLTDLLQEKDNVDEVIVYNNGEDDETKDGLRKWQELGVFNLSVYQEGNLGFTIGFNRALQKAEKPLGTRHISFAISNDVRMTGRFIESAAQILFSKEKVLLGDQLINYDTGWNKFGDRLFPYLAGHFIAATSDGWRDLGYFDEAYAPWDYEDVDLSTTAKEKGYSIIPLNNPHIKHLGSQTIGYNPEREAITRRNREYFQRKWLHA